ncbi:MAG: hypothetical protein SXQ77_05170, partial [Halobacteria archaeon]|nr:hypothetical protein [Halobacteria archaeon]
FEKAESGAEVYQHYLPTTADTGYPNGVYRVVGVEEDDGNITLLKVGEDGRRVNTGVVIHVSEDELSEGFDRAENPDSRFSLTRTLKGIVQGIFWTPMALWYRLR